MINLGIIKDLCKAKGITLTQLGKSVNMAQSTLSISIRTNSMTLANLDKIAKYFDVSVGVFFGEKQDSRYLPYAKLEKYAHKLVIEFVEFIKMITRLRDEMKRGNLIYADKMLATLDNILEHYNNHIIHPNT